MKTNLDEDGWDNYDKLMGVKKSFEMCTLKDISIEINEGNLWTYRIQWDRKIYLLRFTNGLESYDDGLVNVMGNEVKSLNKMN